MNIKMGPRRKRQLEMHQSFILPLLPLSFLHIQIDISSLQTSLLLTHSLALWGGSWNFHLSINLPPPTHPVSVDTHVSLSFFLFSFAPSAPQVPQKIISFSNYSRPFHWPGGIVIMQCGNWECLWWGARANAQASTKVNIILGHWTASDSLNRLVKFLHCASV